MYATNKRHYQIVLTALVIMLVLSLLVSGVASAKEKPPKDKDKAQPQNGQVVVDHKDKPGKEMRVSCHSRHAREAGVPCADNVPNEPPVPTLDEPATENEHSQNSKPVVFPANFPIFAGGGGGHAVHVMM